MAVVVIGMLLLQDGVQVEMADNVVVVGRHDEGTRAVHHKVSTALQSHMGRHETIEVGIGLGSLIAGARVVMRIGIEQDTRRLLLKEATV
jgi:hypothetical protein